MFVVFINYEAVSGGEVLCELGESTVFTSCVEVSDSDKYSLVLEYGFSSFSVW